MQIPDDIRQHVRKKLTKKFVIFGLSEVLIVTFLCLFGKRTFSAFDQFSYVLIHILLICAPILYFRIFDIFLDHSWQGEVVRTSVTTSLDNNTPGCPWITEIIIKNNVYLYVKSTDGKIRRKKAYTGRAKLGHFINNYNPGDFVTHIGGTDFVQIRPEKSADGVICVVCGAVGSKEDNHCKSCTHTLLLTGNDA